MSSDSIDNELKLLDKKIKLAEIRRLESSHKLQWISPAAIGIMLPLIGAFGLWAFNEVKGFNRAYQALEEVTDLKQERAQLLSQKDSLNIELSTLLDLKSHYAGEAERLETAVSDAQTTVDGLYLQAKYAALESKYALGHSDVEQFTLDETNQDELLSVVANMDPDLQSKFQTLLMKYAILEDMSSVTESVLSDLLERLEAIAPSQAARALVWHPSGYIASGRKIMTTSGSENLHYYDVDLGRYLTPSEVTELGVMNDPTGGSSNSN